MIIVYVNSKEDTSTFSPLYEGIEGSTMLYNPSREDVVRVLTERPNESLMCFGHGSPRGLFSHDWSGMVIDGSMVDLLRDRDIIGIWCYASEFARIHNLRGFFTYMFVSNLQECVFGHHGYYDESIIFEQNEKFARRVNELINNNTPLEEWVELLYNGRDLGYSFVDYNYGNLSYFDGEENDGYRSVLVECDGFEDIVFDDEEEDLFSNEILPF